MLQFLALLRLLVRFRSRHEPLLLSPMVFWIARWPARPSSLQVCLSSETNPLLFTLGFGDLLLKESAVDVGNNRCVHVLFPLRILFALWRGYTAGCMLNCTPREGRSARSRGSKIWKAWSAVTGDLHSMHWYAHACPQGTHNAPYVRPNEPSTMLAHCL